MTPDKVKRVGSIFATLLLALTVAVVNPIAAYVYFSCFVSSFIFCNMAGDRFENWDQKA